MKKLVSLFTLVALCMPLSAQYRPEFVPGIYNRDAAELLQQQFTLDLKNRTAKQQVLPVKKWLLNEDHHWTNGFLLFQLVSNLEDRSFSIFPQCGYDGDHIDDPIRVLELKGGKLRKEEDHSTSYTVERLGNYVMLVERNAQGQPVSAYYNVPAEENDNNCWTLIIQKVFAGNYATSLGGHAVFGPKMDFYTGESWHTDPGIFNTFRYDNEGSVPSLRLLYAASRVSRGDPNSPGYKANLPGGGGAGALMDPMEWQVMPTVEGLRVHVVRDEPFVDHNPRVEDNSVVTFVQSPYEGIPGKWAFASVIPLTHQILTLFPKEVLTLMRGEIYARHGDTFSNPATQRYFDAQPWYKKSGKRVVLTDIERFNYALIKQVEMSK